MSALTCAEVEELAAELALGTLPGDQRSDVLGHLDGCPGCRRLVSKLSDTADALLMMAPEIDPPAGFARRALDAMVPRRRSPWPVALAAAAALVLGLATGYAPGHVRSGSVATVQVASFSHTGNEGLTGQVYARAGDPSWIFMTIHDAGSGDAYDCELVLNDGRVVPIGSFTAHGGVGSWGRGVDVALSRIRLVRLRDAKGGVAATAALTAG